MQQLAVLGDEDRPEAWRSAAWSTTTALQQFPNQLGGGQATDTGEISATFVAVFSVEVSGTEGK